MIYHLFKTKNILILFTALVLVAFLGKTVFAVWSGTFYEPGDTLNPECLPTQTDCDVRSPLTSVNISDTAYDEATWNGVSTIAPSKNAIRDKIEGLVAGSHDAVTIGTANGLSLSTQALSLALASTSATGALSSADWNTFNNKQVTLVSNSNIKTVNGTSLLGSGDITQTSVTGNAGTVTNATFTTALTNNGGAGTLTWPAAGATLTIPTGGGTLGTAAFTASSAYDASGAAAAITPTTLGLVIGTNVQAYNSNLTAINQALTTTSSPSFTAVGATTFTGALSGNATTSSNTTGNAATVTNGVYTDAANSMTNIAPLTTLAESWIGPSTTAGIYFKGGLVGIGTITPAAQAKLHVDGGASDAIRVTGSSQGRILIEDSGATADQKLKELMSDGGLLTISTISDNQGSRTTHITLDNDGRFGIGISPTAVLHLKAGTATTSTAPLKFTSGTLLTTPETGAVEFLTDAYYGTITTGAARKTFAFLESPSFTTPTLGVASATSITVPTIIGSTSTTGDLNLQTTSGVGTTGADMHFLVGNNGATEAMTILNSGYVGIGTIAPAGTLHVAGQCVTGDTKLRRRRKKKGVTGDNEEDYEYDETRIDEIKSGDEILSLNEETGKLEYQKVKQLADMGVKPIFKLTTASGKTIRTTGNHPYLVLRESTPSAVAFIDYANIKAWARSKSWAIDMKLLKEILSLIGVTDVLFYYGADPKNEKILKFINVLKKFGYRIVTKPLQYFRITLTELLEQSVNIKWLNTLNTSLKENLIKEATRLDAENISLQIPKANFDVEITIDAMNNVSKYDHFLFFSGDGDFVPLIKDLNTLGKKTSIIAGREFMSQILRDAVSVHAKLEELVSILPELVYPIGQNSSYKKPTPAQQVVERVWENCAASIASLLGLSSAPVDKRSGSWTKVSNMQEGQEIAVASSPDTKEAIWDKIMSIEQLPPEQVYDIEIENTHNFVGNDIIAHNTAIFGAGEGGTPTATTIRGAAATGNNVAGANLTFDASNGTGTGGSGALIFRTAPSAASGSTTNTLAEIMRITPAGNVGIGTTTPNTKLHIAGSTLNYITVPQYTDVADYNNNSLQTGSMQIVLPQLGSDTMLQIKVSGYDYNQGGAGGPWEVILGNYDYSGDRAVRGHGATIRGRSPFNTVRFATNGSKSVVILGTTSTAWSYPKVNVSVTTGYSSVTGWGSGWSISVSSSEAGLSSIVSIPVDFSTNMAGDASFAGNVGIGTTAPAGLLHVSSDTVDLGKGYFTQANASADSFDLNFRKARGTGASPTVITTADELGVINFTGYGGAAGYITGAAIKAISSGTIADSRVPGQLSFWTGTDAAPSVLTERMTIDNAGNVGIGTTAPGTGVTMTGGLTINGTGSTMLNVMKNGTLSFALNPGGVSTAWTMYDFAAGSWSAGISQKSGNVGIGTTSPLLLFEVSRPANPTTLGAGSAAGDWTIGGFVGAASAFYLGADASKVVFTSANSRDIQITPNYFGATGLYINQSGNVGIGTTSPVSRLSVTDEVTSGTRGITLSQNTTDAAAVLFNFRKSRGTASSPLTVTNGDYTGAFLAQNYDGTAYRINGTFGYRVTGAVGTNNIPGQWFWATRTSDDNDPAANGTIRMVIGTDGNVGIGTTAPTTAKLQISSGGLSTQDSTRTFAGITFNSAIGSADSRTLAFNGATTSSVWWNGSGTPQFAIDSMSGGGASFWTNNGSWSERMRIEPTNGNVGIGTTGPTAPLEVYSPNYINLSLFRNGATVGWGNGIEFALKNSAGTRTVYGTIGTGILDATNGAENGALYFGTRNSGTVATVMSVLNTGNVGIGTTVPGQKLDINSATGVNLRLTYNDADGSAANYADLLTTSVGGLTLIPSGNIINIGGGTTATDLRFLEPSGSGANYSAFKAVAQAGDITYSLPPALVAGNQLTDVAGDGVLTWAAAGSSREIKNITGTVTDPNEALTQILQTPIYRFHYKPGMGTGDSATEYVGVIADEAPWAMHYDGAIVNPVNTLGYMVLGIQATNKKIEDLNLNLNGITGTITPLSGSANESFVTAFFNNVYAKVATWLADAGNGITKIFVGEVDTKSLCVSDDTGAKTCISKAELDALIANTASTVGNAGSASGDETTSGTGTPEPTPDSEPEPAPEVIPAPEPVITDPSTPEPQTPPASDSAPASETPTSLNIIF